MNEETLTLYYYDDGLTAAERRAVRDALAADAALAHQYDALCRELAAIHDTESQPLPADMLQRFHDGLDRAVRMEHGAQGTKHRSIHFWSFFWGAAVTAALAVGIGMGFWLSNTDTPAGSPIDDNIARLETPATEVPVAFSRSMQVHFRDSQRDLAGMPLDSDAERIMLILDLIEQNRLYEKAATQNNSDKLARVLRAFEPILLRLAAEDIAPEDAEALRAQLAFELSVMLTKLERETSKETQST